ncbi:hypothetical protein MC885_001113 [Smutsia gigantea]|nr:hypothetical protein MC885_001113 [Smutsia gigantea]
MASRRAGRGPGGLPAAAPARLLLLLLLLGPWPAAGHGGKYSREKNEPEPPPKREPGGEFRMEKLNQLWEKARRYGLDGRKDTQATSNSLNGGAQDDGLGDPRLEKLWHKAKTSGKFSSEELDKLWREFQHHQEKVLEYNILLETLSRTEDVQENVISPSDVRPIKQDVLHSRHAELKDRLRDINQGFDRLRKVSHQGYGTAAEFEEPRVIDLWDLAKSANFTEKELESFREELKHFESKIEKHNHYQKQLEISHQKLKHVESLGDAEHVSRNKEKYALLEEKTKELGYKVKKHLQDLSGRISRARHNEL